MNGVKIYVFTAILSIATALIFSCGLTGEVGGGRGGSCNIEDYKTVQIGSQTWMAENLNCKASGSKCYGNSDSNCDKYGRLYDWETAMTVCPDGWHLPSNDEWDQLYRHADGTYVVPDYTNSPYDSRSLTAGGKLKSKSGWNDFEGQSRNGTDDFGFAALPGGVYVDGFYGIGDNGSWWSSIVAEYFGNDHAYNRGIGYGNEDAFWGVEDKISSLSVRCIQD